MDHDMPYVIRYINTYLKYSLYLYCIGNKRRWLHPVDCNCLWWPKSETPDQVSNLILARTMMTLHSVVPKRITWFSRHWALVTFRSCFLFHLILKTIEIHKHPLMRPLRSLYFFSNSFHCP